jgi:murein L,D-transpeptidase YcbB/YkuD
MKNRRICYFVSLLFFLSVFSGGGSAGPGLSQAVVKDANQQLPGLSPAAPVEGDSARASSQQWHTYVWEALPSEWLQDSNHAALLQAYEENEWRPLFITARFEVDKNAYLLLDRLDIVEHEAIDPRPYKLADLKRDIENLEHLRLSLQAADPGYRDSAADSSASASLQNHPLQVPASESQQTVGASRLRAPDTIKAGEKEKAYRDLFQASSAIDVRLAHNLILFANTMNPFSKELQANALLGQIPMAQFLKELEPPSPPYGSLVQAWHKYQKLALQIPQQRLIQAQKLSSGDTGNSIRDLQKRLQEEDFYHGKMTASFDEATKDAVQKFQLFHNLEADGKVGQQTREWLNVSFQDKADMIAQALKLCRQSQTRRYQKFVKVNIPQFTLEYHNDGKIEAVHRVIVGKASGKKIKLNGRSVGENQTPTLNSAIEQVVINPRWYVTDRIRLELNDAIAADPSYLARNGYTTMTSATYPWGEPRLIQLPGPNNALGRVRFDFPNAYAVYMHDTPNKHLFQRSRRDFSHGCIRVEKAQELAMELLAGEQNPAASRTDAYLATNRETFLRLREPVPIIIEYLPVVVNAQGDLVFCGDPYGWFQETTNRKS